MGARLRDLHVVHCGHSPGNAVHRGLDVAILQGSIHQIRMIKYHRSPSETVSTWHVCVQFHVSRRSSP